MIHIRLFAKNTLSKAFLPFLLSTLYYLIKHVVRLKPPEEVLDGGALYCDYGKFLLVMLTTHIAVKSLLEGTKELMIYRKDQTYRASQENIKNTKDNAKTVTALFQHHELSLRTMKKMGWYILLLVIEYSVMYCLWYVLHVFGSVAYETACCYMFSNKPEKLSFKLAGGNNQGVEVLDPQLDDGSVPNMTHLIRGETNKYYPLLRENGSKTKRILDAKELTDIIEELGSYNFRGNMLALYIFPDGKSVRAVSNARKDIIDISDLTSPTMDENKSVNTNVPLLVYSIFASSDGEMIFYVDFHGFANIKNLSNSANAIKLEGKSSLETCMGDIVPIAAFFSNNTAGFFLDQSQVVSKLDALTSTFGQFVSFEKGRFWPHTLELSTDEKTLFISASDYNIPGSNKLLIMNVSDPSNPVFLTNFTSHDERVYNLAFSPRNNKLYMLTDGYNLQVLDVSQLTNPTLVTSAEINIVQSNGWASNMVLSPDELILAVTINERLLLIDVLDPENPIIFQSKYYNIQFMAISPDSKTILIYDGEKISICKMWVNVELDKRSYSSRTSVSSFNGDYNPSAAAFAPNGQSIFYAPFKDSDCSLNISHVQNPTNLTQQASLELDSRLTSIVVSMDNQTLFGVNGDQLKILDIAKLQEISHLDVKGDTLTMPSNGKTLVIRQTDEHVKQNYFFSIIDVSNRTSPTLYNNIISGQRNQSFINEEVPFTQSNQYLILGLNNTLFFYNLTDLQSIDLAYSIPVEREPHALTISDDGDILYALIDQNFVIYDVSNLTMIKTIAKLELFVEPGQPTYEIKLSSDSRTAYISTWFTIFIIDITNKTSPWLINFVCETHYLTPMQDILSPPNQDGFYFLGLYRSLQYVAIPSRCLFLVPSETFLVGSKFEVSLVFFIKKSNQKYNFIPEDDYKITKAILYSIETGKIPYQKKSALPTWIVIDIENKRLSVMSSSQNDTGSYQILLTVSTIIPISAFDSIVEDSYDLFSTLVLLGYINKGHYLTSDFDPDQDLQFLPSPYNASSQAIMNVLTNYYFDTIMPVILESSLKLVLTETDHQHIQVNTMSQLVVDVNITLYPGSKEKAQPHSCRFLTNIDSIVNIGFDFDNTTLQLSGPIFDVNQVLQRVIIDQSDGISTCNATITVEDRLNRPLTNYTYNISQYFEVNQPPHIKRLDSLQDDVDKVSLSTGDYFYLSLDEGRFNCINLQLTLENSQELHWLTLQECSLSGTPPEELWLRDYHIVITVSNQYKSTPIEFTLHVKYGLGHILKLLGKVGVLVTAYIFFFTAWNLLCKRLYRHPKDLNIANGDQLAGKIFPIACIAPELEQSNYLIKKLEKAVCKHLKRRIRSKLQLVEYFVDPASQQIDQNKLVQMIEEIAATISPLGRNDKRYHYSQFTDVRRDLITQLVVNEIVIRQLSLKREQATKQAFESLKSSWALLIHHEANSPAWQLSIDETQLKYLLSANGFDQKPMQSKDSQKSHMKTFELTSTQSLSKQVDSTIMNSSDTTYPNNNSSSGLSNNLNTELISTDKTIQDNIFKEMEVNINLLRNALLARTYRKYHLNVDVTDVNVCLLRETNGPWYLPKVVAKLVKRDLRPVRSATGKILGYGLRHKIEGGAIYFFGVVEGLLEGTTTIVQINRKLKIVKELWMNCVINNSNDLKQRLVLENDPL